MKDSVLSWGVADVAAWLRSADEALDGVAARAEAGGVDGPTLLELDAAAWQELGIQSAVLRAKLVAAAKRAGAKRRKSATTKG